MRHVSLAVTTLVFCSSAFTQTALKPRAAEPGSSASALPITRVALYKNGVGYFEHAGHVTGDQSVTIDFTSAQLNDVLQSLTAIDLNGGRISGAGYNSTTPLDQQLKTLALGLDADPSDQDFYEAIRGTRVQVAGPGVEITGRLLSIDLRATTSPDHRFLTVISDAGQARTVEITPSVSVTLLDTALHTDVTRYLELLASSRSQGLRHLTLLDRAPTASSGSRDLRVSYISEVPVWKSTYRVLFTSSKQATDPTVTLQGWSVVDNTTGEDWINVHLDLIAGAPQSFIQPLSIPYYARRPMVGLPSQAQLSPQTHDSGELQPPPKPGSGAPQGGQIMVDGFLGGQLPPRSRAQSVAVTAAQNQVSVDPGSNSSATMLAGKDLDALSDDADELASQLQSLASASISPNTTTAAFDDFFKYALSDPITIRKNESALVPILQTKLPVERVTLWSAKQPVALRALWITNSSDLTLDRGSFSVVEDGSFGGEGLLDPIHPGEKRLLSYAADEAVHINVQPAPGEHRLRTVTAAKGIVSEFYRDVNARDYTIRNAAPESRTVIIEHTRSSGFDLTADTAKPDETLPNVYRFRVTVPAGQTVHFKVAESHSYLNNLSIGSINDQTVRFLLQQMGQDAASNPALLQQLKPVLDAQTTIADIQARKSAVDRQLVNLGNEEKRQRDNITALKDADKLSQKRFVDELGKIEDQILDLQKQQKTLDTQLEAARADLANKVQAVQYNQTLEP